MGVGIIIKKNQEIIDKADPFFLEMITSKTEDEVTELLLRLEKERTITRNLNKDTTYVDNNLEVLMAYLSLKDLTDLMEEDLKKDNRTKDKLNKPNSVTFV